jgi:hypothetical protein
MCSPALDEIARNWEICAGKLKTSNPVHLQGVARKTPCEGLFPAVEKLY